MRRFGSVLFLCAFSSLFAETAGKRPLQLDDLYRFQEVSDPRCSPDGKWIAYSVATIDREADKRHTNIWMVSWDGAQDLRLTYDTESDSSPRWSPDGKYLSFVSSRAGKAKGSQVWVLDRRGGEARQLTHVKDYSISQYE
jgi:Tol biopolymer transport system component